MVHFLAFGLFVSHFIIHIGLEEDKSQPGDVMICGSWTLTSIGSSSDNSFIGMKV
jgi:hypothetical protein